MSDVEPAKHWQRQPLPWQATVLDQFGARLAENKLPHALLVSGAAGLGKGLFAESLAALILCADPVNFRACGVCDSCGVAQGGGHGDYRWLAPPPDKRIIPIDDVRAMLGFVQKTSGYGSRKVVVIAPAEAMNKNSAAALLKTLEEPAGNSVLVLVSHRPSDLPATVRSRCQRVMVPAPTPSEAAAWLTNTLSSKGLDTRQQPINHALEVTNHRPLAALELIVNGTLDGVRERTLLIQRLMAGEISAIEASASLASESPEDLLTAIYQVVSGRLTHASAEDLSRFGPNMFVASDTLVKMLSAVRAGVNPAKDILFGEACGKVAGIWPSS